MFNLLNHHYITKTTANIINCLVFLMLLLSSCLLIVTSSDLKSASAHVFLSDKNASRLAIEHQLKAELKLINQNLVQSDYNLALRHLADITEIQTSNNNISSSFSIPNLDELHKLIESLPANPNQQQALLRINETIDYASRFLDNQIVSEVDAQDLRNSTIQALNIANMTDEILREYATAYGIEPVSSVVSIMNMNMPNMSSSANAPSAGSMGMNGNGMKQLGATDSSNISRVSKIVNISNYQNAQGLALEALEAFRDDLKPLKLPTTTKSYLATEIRSSSVSELEKGLSLLLHSIEDKKPYSDIMQIIHGPIHTNLFLAYDLKMMSE
jgi:hypothetical protein